MAKINLSIEADTVEEFQTILGQLQSTQSTKAVVDAITQTLASEAGTEETPKKEEVKKAPEKKKPAKKQTAKKEKASTEPTADTEQSKPGTEKLDEEPSVEKSATPGKYPNATKKDVQDAMKKAMSSGKRDAIKTAFGRSNATKLSELKEEDYSVFLTDLELLAGE